LAVITISSSITSGISLLSLDLSKDKSSLFVNRLF